MSQAFRFVTCDPAEDYMDLPESLMPLSAWYDAHRQGTVDWVPERYEGVGVAFDDGEHRYVEVSFGDLRSMAAGAAEAASRLGEGRTAVLRTALLDVGSYLLLVPEDDHIRMVESPDGPPDGTPFPFRPSRTNDPDELIDSLYRWGEEHGQRLLVRSDDPPFDRARGLDLRLQRQCLIDALQREAAVAAAVAEAVGAPTFGPASPRGAAPGPLPASDPASTGATELLRSETEPPAAVPGRGGRVVLTGVEGDHDRVKLLRLLRTAYDLQLEPAKALLAKVAAGEPVLLEAGDPSQAARWLEEATEAGARAHIAADPQDSPG